MGRLALLIARDNQKVSLIRHPDGWICCAIHPPFIGNVLDFMLWPNLRRIRCIQSLYPGKRSCPWRHLGSLSQSNGMPERFAGGFISEASPPAPRKPRLLDRVRKEIRKRHYSRRTERAYVAWIHRFILFHGKRHPAEMGEHEVSRYLSHLAVHGKVSASTQNQALSALLFLYRQVLCRNIEWVEGVVRAKRPMRLPVVLTREEVRAVLRQLQGVEWMMASLLYGSGVRLLACCRLRVKDVDLLKREIVVRDGKGGKVSSHFFRRGLWSL